MCTQNTFCYFTKSNSTQLKLYGDGPGHGVLLQLLLKYCLYILVAKLKGFSYKSLATVHKHHLGIEFPK